MSIWLSAPKMTCTAVKHIFIASRRKRKETRLPRARVGGLWKDRKGVAMAGGMDVHKNRYVEEWAAARENLEKTFPFNRRTLTADIICGIVLPYVTYRGIVTEFDQLTGRPPCKFLGP